jgi:hypothetical protein
MNNTQLNQNSGAAQPALLDEAMIRAQCRCSNAACKCQSARGNVHCPAHSDEKPALSVTTENGKTLFKCHANCSQEAVLSALRSNHAAPVAAPSAKTANVKSKASKGAPVETATHIYTDEEDKTLYRVQRKKFADGSKDFPTSRPDGNGGWVYSLGDVRRVLYRLADVIKAKFVIVCEGEKAADRVNEALKEAGLFGDFAATTNAHGAGKWHPEYAETLAGKTVYICPDDDEQGRAHSEQIASSAAPVARDVRLVELPHLPHKGDAVDFFEQGGHICELLEIAEAAPSWTAATAAEEPAAPRRFPRFTLGEIFTRPRLEYLIQGMFIEQGTGVVSADYGGFKSFVALDMGLCVATGRDWMHRATKRGSVVYITPEGSYQHADRIKAWMKFHGITELPENFEIIELPVQIGDASQCALLIDELREMNPAFIILDTVAKCNIGRDENDAAAMGLFTDGMEKVSRELGAFVLAIHHNNKNGTARGSVSLPANVDASLTLKRSPGRIVTIGCDRVKGAPFDDFSLFGQIVETGEADENSAPITSLVFMLTDTPATAIPQADQTREQVLEALRQVPEGLPAKKWQEASGLSSSRFYDYRDELQKSGKVTQEGRIYKVTPITPIAPNRSESEPLFYSDYSDDALASEQSEQMAGQREKVKPKRRAKNSADDEPYRAAEAG